MIASATDDSLTPGELDIRLRARRIRHRLTGLLAAICAVCAGLVGSTCREDGPELPDEHTTLTVLYPYADEWSIWDNEIPFLVFSTLAAVGEDGEVEGRLARSWEHSPDYRTWTIHLRSDVLWHDGQPFTARDVEFTVNLWKQPETMREAGTRVESLVVHDDTTFTITFRNFNVMEAQCLPGCWNIFYPKHLLEGRDLADFDRSDFWLQPVGNGPYRYVRNVPQTLVELEANPEYFLGKPAIDRLILKFGENSIAELLAGNVDAVNFARESDALTLRSDPRFNIYREVWDDVGAVQAIFWNQRTHPPFRDPRVRRALTLGIDRHELREAVNISEHVPVFDGAITSSQYRSGAIPAAVPHDPEAAARLLSESGWEDRDGDGIRDRDEVPLRFELITSPRWAPAAVYVQDQLARLGVRMEILTLESPVARERHVAGDFEASLNYVWAVPGPHPRGLEVFLGEGSVLGFENDRIPELLSRADALVHPDSVGAIYAELSSIVREELPYTYPTLNVMTYIAHKRVKGLSSPFRANPAWNAEHLWIEDEY